MEPSHADLWCCRGMGRGQDTPNGWWEVHFVRRGLQKTVFIPSAKANELMDSAVPTYHSDDELREYPQKEG